MPRSLSLLGFVLCLLAPGLARAAAPFTPAATGSTLAGVLRVLPGEVTLTLRGYDPTMDHFVLTRQALGRRVDREAPARSLMLLKPTMALAHGGGQKLEVGSADYRVLADWIAAGAPGPRSDDARIRRLE